MSDWEHPFACGRDSSTVNWWDFFHHKLVLLLRGWVYTRGFPPLQQNLPQKASPLASMAPKVDDDPWQCPFQRRDQYEHWGHGPPHTQSIVSASQMIQLFLVLNDCHQRSTVAIRRPNPSDARQHERAVSTVRSRSGAGIFPSRERRSRIRGNEATKRPTPG